MLKRSGRISLQGCLVILVATLGRQVFQYSELGTHTLWTSFPSEKAPATGFMKTSELGCSPLASNTCYKLSLHKQKVSTR